MTSGAGALSRARKVTLPCVTVRTCVAVLCAMAGVMAFTSAPALAAAPETPGQVEVSPVTAATSAFVRGPLTPGKRKEPFEALQYRFLYREAKSLTECQGGSETPESSSPSEFEFDRVQTSIEGLTAHTEYTVCLQSSNAEGTRVGPPAHFRTAIALEVPETLPATEVTGTTAKLNGLLNPNQERKAEPGSYEFIYKQSGTECNEEVSTSEHTLSSLADGSQGELVASEVTGLLPTTQYTFCVRVGNESGEQAVGGPVTFTTTTAAPVVSEESIANLTSSEAVVNASISPGGVPATYKIEYGTSSVEEHSLPEHGEYPLPASTVPVPVRQTLTGLTPGTQYHLRFVAVNVLGTVPGAPIVFTTAPGAVSTSSLPDERSVELVSSAFEEGEVYVPAGTQDSTPSGIQDASTSLPFRAAADGSSVVYVADPGKIGGNGSVGKGKGNTYLAVRGPGSGQQGWESTNITPALTVNESLSEAEESTYETFSPDLSTGILRSFAEPIALSAQPNGPPHCFVLYSRAADGSFHALFTSTQTPGNCGVPEPEGNTPSLAHFVLAGAAQDGKQFFFQSPAALIAQAVEAEGGGDNLYVSTNGLPTLVNVLPSGALAPNATYGGPSEAASTPRNFSHAISSDGSRAFWTDLSTGRVYVRVNGERTVEVSEGPAKFLTASSRGDYAFYTDSGKLWRFNVSTATREAIATSGINPSEGAGVQGIIGASEDGSYAYFVAEGALSSGAEPRKCEAASTEPGEAEEKAGRLPVGLGCNLYAWHAGGPPVFIAALSARDNMIEEVGGGGGVNGGDWTANQGRQTAQVAPDGQRVAFQSQVNLTGYDTSPLGNNRKHEIFTFEFVARRLACVSCDPTGAPPRPEGNGFGNLGAGSHLPASINSTFARRLISEDGTRIFFESSQPLVSSDTNGVQDVYEWEQEGSGSCAVLRPPTPSRPSGGCVFLLSGGESGGFSYLIDASVTGDDVFIAHRGQLGGVGPADSKMHLYDVRVDGGFPQSSTACTGTGCQGVPPAPPSFATPSSATFFGAGNFSPATPAKPKAKTVAQVRAEHLAKALEACRRKRDRHKRALCEHRAQKRYGPRHKASRATTKRRAPR
jgi:Fibronectin type III domain